MLKTTGSKFYFNIYTKFSRHIHLINLFNIQNKIRYIFHRLGLRKYPDRSKFEDNWDFNYRIKNSIYDTPLEKIMLQLYAKFIATYSYTIHYIILGLITLYDIMFNDFILSNTFKIMPYIFIYDIIVRICKFQDDNVTTNDGIIYEFLYSHGTKLTRYTLDLEELR